MLNTIPNIQAGMKQSYSQIYDIYSAVKPIFEPQEESMHNFLKRFSRISMTGDQKAQTLANTRNSAQIKQEEEMDQSLKALQAQHEDKQRRNEKWKLREKREELLKERADKCDLNSEQTRDLLTKQIVETIKKYFYKYEHSDNDTIEFSKELTDVAVNRIIAINREHNMRHPQQQRPETYYRNGQEFRGELQRLINSVLKGQQVLSNQYTPHVISRIEMKEINKYRVGEI